MGFTAAYAVDGVSYPAELQRLANSALAPETSGVVAPRDLLVRGLGAAGVSVDPGAAVIANTYAAAGFRQSYLVGNDAADDDAVIAVPAAGSSSARTDFLILRVYDTQYAGQTDPTGKGSGLQLVAALPTGYPYVALAKIVQPAGNTAGIQQSMVTDLRKVASPRTSMVTIALPSLPDDQGMLLNNQASGEWWPNANGPQDIDIPVWASRAVVECEWLAVNCPGGANPWGNIWVEYGPAAATNHREQSTQKFQFSAVQTGDAKNMDLKVADDVVIPKAYRGTTQKFVPFGAYSAGYDVSKGKLTLTEFSGMVMKVTFREAADSDAGV